MADILITRHTGAVEWAMKCGYSFDKKIKHLDDISSIEPNNRYFGILPVNLAAEVCAIGSGYFHLNLEIPPHLRGVELDAEQLSDCNAHFEQFFITKV